MSNGINSVVGEGVLDGKLAILVGVVDSGTVITGVRIGAVLIGAFANCVGGIVGLTDMHPVKAKTGTKTRDAKDKSFIGETFLNDLVL